VITAQRVLAVAVDRHREDQIGAAELGEVYEDLVAAAAQPPALTDKLGGCAPVLREAGTRG
jgi:hypothetical protein